MGPRASGKRPLADGSALPAAPPGPRRRLYRMVQQPGSNQGQCSCGHHPGPASQPRPPQPRQLLPRVVQQVDAKAQLPPQQRQPHQPAPAHRCDGADPLLYETLAPSGVKCLENLRVPNALLLSGSRDRSSVHRTGYRGGIRQGIEGISVNGLPHACAQRAHHQRVSQRCPIAHIAAQQRVARHPGIAHRHPHHGA